MGIPLVILTYVVGLYGLTAALLGAGVLWMFVPGFVAGSASQHWGGEPTPWGRIRYRFSTDYTGWVARVATGRSDPLDGGQSGC